MLIFLSKAIEELGKNYTKDQLKEFVWKTLKSGQVSSDVEVLWLVELLAQLVSVFYVTGLNLLKYEPTKIAWFIYPAEWL